MDFTYLIAGILSLLVGLAGSVVFVLARGRSYGKFLALAVASTLVADFALLLDWSRVEEMTAEFLLTDLAFFTLYGLVGCAVGASPVLGGRLLYRWAKRFDAA